MYRKQIKRVLRSLLNWRRQRSESRLSAAVLETLEQRQLLAFTVAHEPYLQLGNAPLVGSTSYGGTDQVQIIWQTSGTADVGEQFLADYRVVGAGSWTSAGAPVVDTPVTVLGQSRVNRSVTISGLSFDTQYEYRITWDKAVDTIYSKQFHTRLAPGSTTNFTFVAYGDSAEPDADGNANFRALVSRISGINPAFSVLMGDNAYNGGTYDDMENRLNPSLVPGAMYAGPVVADYISKHIEYPAFGNHDIWLGGSPGSPNASPPGAATTYNFSVPVPAASTSLVPGPVGTTAEHNFSFDYGNVHFLSFEGNYCDVPGDNCYTNDSTTLDKELDWAVADLKESDAKWKIVFVHQPAYSVVGHTLLNLQTTYYNKVVSRLGKDGAGADLLLAGHAHNYQRSYPLVGPYDDGLGHKDATATFSNYTKGSGLTQVISGLGGHDIETGAAPNPLPGILAAVFSDGTAVPSFLKIDVTANVLTLRQVRSDNGATMDTFTITAPDDTTAPTAFLAGPLDNGVTDVDADPDQVTVTTSQTAFIVKLKDSGDGINDSSPTSSSTVTLKKDGVTLVAGTDYTYSYDGPTNRIKLTAPGGSPFTIGAYEVTVNGGIVSDNHGTPNVMAARTFTVNIETTSGVTTTPLIAKGGAWHYYHPLDGSNPFTTDPNFVNWTQPTFTETGWTTAPATTGPLGYGVLNDSPGTNITPRPIGANPPLDGSKYTAYFRRTFTVAEPAKVLSLVVNLLRDDGAAVYLNGTEVIRTSNLAAVYGAAGHTTLANLGGAPAIGGAFESAYFSYRIDPALLVTGTNLIAVEVHQQATNSSDLGFDLELLGPTPRVTQTFNSTTGDLVINGTTRNDLLDISYDGTYVTVHGVRLSPIAPAASVTSITVNGRAGSDTIDLTNVNTAHGFNEGVLIGHVTVQGDAGDDIITGSNMTSPTADADRLFGGDGNDNINGGAGRDILIGGNGNDILVGGADNDTADYSANTASQPVNINLNGLADDSDGLGGTDSVDVETVLGGAGDDILTGSASADVLKGNDGNDHIDGGPGDDTLYGDAGLDRIHGDDGNDSIHGGTGDDALFGDKMAYGGAGSPGNDVIWGDEGNDDIIGGHWAITSNDGSDGMYGGSGSDRFYFVGGNQGDDIITDDQQDVPTDTDWIIFSGWSNSITLHLDAAYIGTQQFLAGGGSITLTTLNSIENIWGGDGNDYLYGDDRANYLDGQNGNDHLYGNGGNDGLAGYYGYDYLYGGDGDDRMWPEYDGGEMYGELGNDTYDFVMTSGANYYVYEYAIQGTDNSSDTLDFIGAAGPVNIDLASTNFQSMAGITLKLSDGMGIENVYCSENSFFNWSDTLSGNARPNILKGGVGDDWIYGYDGNDQLYGEDGNDHIEAGYGADTLWGGNGDDDLYAFSDGSVDQVHGDAGSDTLHGIDGNDVLDSIELNLAT